MKFIKQLIVTTMVLFSAASFAIPTTFMSGNDDGCFGCPLENQTGKNYINPNSTELDGASWIQPNGTWKVDGEFRVFELDLNKNSMTNFITSLFVAFDDNLMIKSNREVLFDSTQYGINKPWAQVTDIINLTGELAIKSNGRLNFYVENTNGPTGVIWKGMADTTSSVSVPAPTTIAFFALGLLGLRIARKTKKTH